MSKRRFSTRTLVTMAMLAAISVVLARLIMPMLSADTRYSIERVPIVIAGILFGPFAGGLVGLVADTVGCLFSGYGWNPLFSVPPVLYGVFAGVIRIWFARESKPAVWKLLVAFLVPALFGSVLWQSFPLSFYYGVNSGKGYWAYVITRLPQFAVTVPIETAVTWLLFRSGMFSQLKLWPNANYVKKLDEHRQ